MQNCEKCGRPMRVTFANKGEGTLLRGKMFVCEHADCEAFMLSQRPNTGMKTDAAIALDGDGESSTRGAAYA